MSESDLDLRIELELDDDGRLYPYMNTNTGERYD
jgi:hypothetical protein